MANWLVPLKLLLSPRRDDEAKPERVAQLNSPPVQWKLCELPVHVERPAPWRLAVNRLDEDAVVEKKLVEVEFVVVDCRPVKFRRVVEPVRRMLAKVVTLSKVLVPLKWLLSPRRDDEAMPEMTPQVTLPLTTLRALDVVQLPVAMNRLDEEAVVAKKLVEVEFVVVDCSPVKFWSVDEPVTFRLPADAVAA